MRHRPVDAGIRGLRQIGRLGALLAAMLLGVPAATCVPAALAQAPAAPAPAAPAAPATAPPAASAPAAKPSPTDYVTVYPGDSTPVLQSGQKIDLGSVPPQRGKVSVTSSMENGTTIWRLIYAANDVTGQADDKLTYWEAGQDAERILQITIKPRELGFNSSSVTYETGFKALFILFVLAVLLESGLAIVFNWRPFVESLNARAVRPLISFAVALAFVKSYHLDTVTTLVNAFAATPNQQGGAAGTILTAMIIAGGSAGVYNLLVAFGYRQQRTPETVVPKPPPGKAWISVKLQRKDAVGPVTVLLGSPTPRPAGGPALKSNLPVAGVLRGNRPWLAYFRADPTRFPSYGGHAVAKDAIVEVRLTGKNAQGGDIETGSWGPYEITEGAFVDITLTL